MATPANSVATRATELVSQGQVTTAVAEVVFETNRWPYLLTLPISWALTLWVIGKKLFCRILDRKGPDTNTFWFDGLGPLCRKIKEGAASWRALDVIYNWRLDKSAPRADNFWIGMVNAQAVRNRLKVVKRELANAILEIASGNGEVRILSLAAGSAQGVIELTAEMQARGISVRSFLVDIDQTALDYALELASRHGVADRVTVLKGSVSQVARISQGFQPHIIEMLGLLDYIPEAKAIKLLSKIRETLPVGGTFFTCNIHPNLEQLFLQWVINWPMLYRTKEQLASIVERAGFGAPRLVSEPLGLHTLAISTKGKEGA